MQQTRPAVFTFGHLTRSLAQFFALLKTRAVHRVIDVSTMPHSRHNSRFDALLGRAICQRNSAPDAGIRESPAT
jgi:hypothetical protein